MLAISSLEIHYNVFVPNLVSVNIENFWSTRERLVDILLYVHISTQNSENIIHKTCFSCFCDTNFKKLQTNQRIQKMTHLLTETMFTCKVQNLQTSGGRIKNKSYDIQHIFPCYFSITIMLCVPVKSPLWRDCNKYQQCTFYGEIIPKSYQIGTLSGLLLSAT